MKTRLPETHPRSDDAVQREPVVPPQTDGGENPESVQPEPEAGDYFHFVRGFAWIARLAKV